MAKESSVMIEFRIASIDVLSYMCTEMDVGEIAIEDIDIAFAWSLRVIEPERLVEIQGAVDGSGGSDMRLFSMTVRCSFSVSEPGTSDRAGTNIHLPDGFVIELLAITYATMRGVLSERLAGSRYKGVILPPVDPALLYYRTLNTPPRGPRRKGRGAASGP